MAKSKLDELPTITSVEKVEVVETQTPKFGTIKIEIIAVDVPFVTTATEGYEDSEDCRRCDVGVLSRDQARKLRAIRRGYDYSQSRLKNGNEVKSLADAVRAWLDSVEI